MSVPIVSQERSTYIGRSNWSSDSYANAIFDEIRISNKARSPQEFNLQLPPTNLTAALTSSTAATLTWQNGGGMSPLSVYRIYRGSSPTNVSRIDSTNSTILRKTQGWHRLRRITTGSVQSTRPGFEGVMSNAVVIKTCVPSTPTLLLPVNATFQPPTLVLVWNFLGRCLFISCADWHGFQFLSRVSFYSDSRSPTTSKWVKSSHSIQRIIGELAPRT